MDTADTFQRLHTLDPHQPSAHAGACVWIQCRVVILFSGYTLARLTLGSRFDRTTGVPLGVDGAAGAESGRDLLFITAEKFRMNEHSAGERGVV